MKKSKITLIALIIGIAAIAGIVAYYLMNRGDQEDSILSFDQDSGEETDYLDDLDAPEFPEKEEKVHTRVRRGYIPIRLGRH